MFCYQSVPYLYGYLYGYSVCNRLGPALAVTGEKHLIKTSMFDTWIKEELLIDFGKRVSAPYILNFLCHYSEECHTL